MALATITATSHNGLKTTCEIIVTVSVDEIEISLVDAKEAVAEVSGDDLQLRAVAYDLDGSSENVAQSFTWTSSNNAVATVKEGEDGTAAVTGLQARHGHHHRHRQGWQRRARHLAR